MEKHKLESMLIDYIDGKLNSVDKHHIEQELLRNRDSFKLYEELKEVIYAMSRNAVETPPADIRRTFDDMLAQEILLQESSKVRSLNVMWYRIAAAVLLLITGVSAGIWISNSRNDQERVAMEKQEQLKISRTVSMMQDQNSAAQRILGMKSAISNDDIDSTLFRILIKTLNSDPNTNVRMAALDGLLKFYDNPQVKAALISSLAIQDDPVLQIALIQVLVSRKESEVLKPLEKIVNDEETLPVVKDEANMGILVLS
jgi:hypothetical protein